MTANISLLSRVYAWVRATGQYHSGGWSEAQSHVRLVELLDSLGITGTHKGRKVYFTLLTDEKEPLDFWSIKGDSFLEETFVIKHLTACKSNIRLISQDDEFAFMFMASEHGYTFSRNQDTITRITKSESITNYPSIGNS